MPALAVLLLSLLCTSAALAQTGDFTSREQALKGLASANPARRAEAVSWIAENGKAADSDALRQRLTDENPVVRGYAEQGSADVRRVAYVQPVYRFAAEGEREVWQCGVELFGAPAATADGELLLLARDFLAALGLGSVTC